MISRRSSIALGEAYRAHFHISYRLAGDWTTKLDQEGLYDFLYANNFDAWLMNGFRKISIHDKRGLKEFVMRIHTGESIAAATQSWSWEQRQSLGQRILKDLAESLIRLRHSDPDYGAYKTGDKKAVDDMQKAFELDGYIYREGILLVPEEGIIEEREEEGVLLGLIETVDLEDPQTLKHHLGLSASHYQESRWDDSISNSRKVLEGVLQQAAGRFAYIPGQNALTSDMLAKPFLVRDYLEKVGLLEKKEKETLAHVYGLLSDTGGHPNIAHRDQARFNETSLVNILPICSPPA